MIRKYQRYRASRRWLIVLALLAAVAFHAVLIGRFLLSPEQFRIRTQLLLQRDFRGEVQLGQARYEFPLGFQLDEIRLSRSAERGGGELFAAKALRVELSPLALLRGRLAVEDLVLEQPELTLKTTDLAEVEAPRPEIPKAPVDHIIIRNGHIFLGKNLFFQGSPERELRDVSVEFRRALRLANGYEFEGEAQSSVWGRCDLEGTLDLGGQRLDVRGVAHGITIDARLRELLPKDYVRALDRYNVEGTVDLTADSSIALGKGGKTTFGGALSLRDCSAAWERFPLKLAEIRGKVVFDDANIYYQDLTARAGPATVTLQGQTTREKIDFHVVCRGRPLDHELYEAATPPLQRLWKRCGVEGGMINVDFHSTWWRSDERFEAAARVELRDARGTFETFPYPLADVAGTIRWENGASTIESITGRRGNARVRITGQVTDKGAPDILVEAFDVPLDDALLKALPAGWRSVLATMEPQGTAAIQCRVTSRDGDPHKLQYRLLIRPEGASFLFKEFPHRITDVRGDILIDEAGTLSFRELRGRLGGIPLNFLGTVRSEEKTPLLDVTVAAPEVELGPAARAYLAPTAARVYGDLDPSGKVRVNWRIATDPATGKLQHSTEIQCLQDCSIQYRHFPVRVTGLMGRLFVEGGGRSTFSGVRGRVGNAVVEAVAGNYLPGPKGGLRMTLRATGLVLTDAVRAAVPENWRKAWDEAQPAGEVNVEYQYSANPEKPDRPSQRTSIEPVDASFTYRGLPLPIADVTRGKLLFDQDGNVTISNVQGKLRGKTVTLNGKITGREGGSELRLEVTADELPLDAELRGMLPKAWQETWDRFQLSGRVGITATAIIDLTKNDWQSFGLDAALKGCDATYPKLPIRLTGLRGRVEADNGVVTLTDVVGSASVADQVSLSGRVSSKPGAEDRLQIRVQNLRFGPELLAALPADPRKAVEAMGLQGAADVDLTLTWSPKAEGATQSFGLVRLRDCSLGLPIRLEQVSGTVRIDSGLVAADGSQKFQGGMDLRRLRYHRYVVTDLKGAFDYTRTPAQKEAPPQSRVAISDVVGSFYGGRLSSRMDFAPDGGGKFAGWVAVRGSDFKVFSQEALGITDPATGVLDMRLEFPASHYKSEKGLIGEGDASVTRGELGQLPLTASLFNTLGLRSPLDRSITEAEMKFGLGKDQLVVKELVLEGEQRLMTGLGTIGYDGSLNLRLVSPKSGGIPIIQPLIASQLVQIDVRGTVTKPEFHILPVPIAGELLDQFVNLFGLWRKEKVKEPGAPEPPPAPAPN